MGIHIVALGLIVDATEQNQREKHEQILNDLGREEWEAVAYIAQSDTVLLKDRRSVLPIEKRPGSAGDHRLGLIACNASEFTAKVRGGEGALFFLMLLPLGAELTAPRFVHSFS
jgi:hypothetical protein